jgi:hypothetical protein
LTVLRVYNISFITKFAQTAYVFENWKLYKCIGPSAVILVREKKKLEWSTAEDLQKTARCIHVRLATNVDLWKLHHPLPHHIIFTSRQA